MKKLLICLLPLLLVYGCGTIKEIPVETIEKVVVRDSLIYINNTVTIEVPKEVAKEVVPADTTSVLNTSLATSTAEVKKGKLHHTLEQKGEVKAKIDTVVRVEYVEKIVKQEIPIIKEIEKTVIPTWCWLLLIGNVLIIAVKVTRFIYKT